MRFLPSVCSLWERGGFRDLIVFVIMDNSCEFVKNARKSGVEAQQQSLCKWIYLIHSHRPTSSRSTISPPGWQTFRPILK